jgi:2-polyprenyl-3-methyl-5-hydroxy-6-metoxy-1,4-benzoquinol methylase
MFEALARHLNVPDNFSVEYRDDVYSVFEKNFKQRLEKFMTDFSRAQEKTRQPALTSAEIACFPFVGHRAFRHETFTRRQDLAILEKILKHRDPERTQALEVGGWNGWLSKWLQAEEFDVISTDIFRDERNGLASKKFHHNGTWFSVQTDITQTTIFKSRFDLVILNHCIQFLPEPEKVLKRYIDLLNPGGILVLLGIDYRKNEMHQKRKVDSYRKLFYAENGFEINFYPSKGYVDSFFVDVLRQNGFKFEPYMVSVFARFAQRFNGNHSGIYYFQNRIN